MHSAWFRCPSNYLFLSQMTSLTSLVLPFRLDSSLTPIQCCSLLQSLRLQLQNCSHLLSAAAALAPPFMSQLSQEWLQPLTQLTALHLMQYVRVVQGEGMQSAVAALSKLLQQPLQQRLRVLEVGGLTLEALPALHTLPQLTELRGSWWPLPRRGRSNSSSTTLLQLSSVRKLAGNGPIPWQAFPNLQVAEQCATWEAAQFKDLAQHCKQVQRISKYKPIWFASINGSQDNYDPSQVLVAIGSLCKLPQLTELHFAPKEELHLLPLVQMKQLKVLLLHINKQHMCSSHGLVQAAMELASTVGKLKLDLSFGGPAAEYLLKNRRLRAAHNVYMHRLQGR